VKSWQITLYKVWPIPDISCLNSQLWKVLAFNREVATTHCRFESVGKTASWQNGLALDRKTHVDILWKLCTERNNLHCL